MNPELISLISGSLGYLSALVAQGAVSRIGEGFTESIAELLHEVAHGDRKAERRLATFEDEPDDDSNRERLAQQLAEQLAGNTEAIERLTALLAEVQSAYPDITIGESTQTAIDSQNVAQAAHGGQARQRLLLTAPMQLFRLETTMKDTQSPEGEWIPEWVPDGPP
jgi:hypothetical protein